jgi:hypothetical protein
MELDDAVARAPWIDFSDFEIMMDTGMVLDLKAQSTDVLTPGDYADCCPRTQVRYPYSRDSAH